MEQRTHHAIRAEWVGRVENLEEGESLVALVATEAMAADDRGLVHGGFTFGLADYAAMVAVNHPNVVLGGSEVRFTAPVRVGQRMEARARVGERKGSKSVVEVEVTVEGKKVMGGTFTTFSLEHHVLEGT